MLMNVSNYEIILPLIGEDEKEIKSHTLLINGLYGAIDVVTKEAADKIKSGDIEKLPATLIEHLEKRGHLTKKTLEDEMADLKLLARIYKTIPGRSGISLIIMPTYDCNFRCPYCYEQHRLKNGKEWLESTISSEMIDSIFEALKNYKSRGYNVSHCTFYGGEPFLEKNISTVKEIAQRCKDMDMTISGITNGYDFDKYIAHLDEIKVEGLQVTVDGKGKINDCRRIHKDGLPTYDRILKNVELALGHGIDISLRVNVGRENLHDIKNLIDDLEARGFIEKEEARAAEEERLKKTSSDKVKTKRGIFHYYFKATNNDNNPQNNIKEQDIIDELTSKGLNAAQAIKVQSQYSSPASHLRSVLQKKYYPSFVPNYCGAEQGMLVIDPFGKVYTCWDAVGKEDEGLVGFTDVQSKRFMFNFNKAKWRTRTVDIMESCRTCPYAFMCRGGCAARAFYQNGSYFREHCGENKEIIDFVASRVVGAEWSKNHVEELSLTLKEPLLKLTEEERQIIMTTRSQKEMFDIVKAVGLLKESEEDKNGKD